MPRYYVPKGKNQKRPRLVQIRKKVPKKIVQFPKEKNDADKSDNSGRNGNGA